MRITKQRLREVLSRFPGIGTVEISENGRLAMIASSAFAELDEGDRQEMLWEFLQENLEESEVDSVEFVFTHTPEELDAAA